MSRSASTPRLQATLWFYLLLVAATAIAGRPQLSPAAGLGLDLLAVLLVGFAVLGRIWCSVFIAGRKDAELVSEGPYGLCRHPLYTLSMIGAAGLGAATHSLLLTGVAISFLVAVFWRASTAEERLLESLHGDRYRHYQQTVPRFVPRGKLSSAPDQLLVRPPVLWKAFLDGGSFVVLLLLVIAARSLREIGYLPALLALP